MIDVTVLHCGKAPAASQTQGLQETAAGLGTTVPAGRIQVLPPPPRGQFEAKGKDGARRFWGVDRLGSQREGPSPSVSFLAPSVAQRRPAGRPPSATNPADRS